MTSASMLEAAGGGRVLGKRREEVVVHVRGDGITFDDPFRMDLVVNDTIIIENKVVEVVLPLHKAQLRSYLKLANRRLGLLINFNVELLKDGIHRVVNGDATYDL